MEEQYDESNEERYLSSMNDNESDSSPIDHDFIDSFGFPDQSFKNDQFYDSSSSLNQSNYSNTYAFPMFSSKPNSDGVQSNDDPSKNKNSNIHSNDNQKSNSSKNFNSKSKNLKNTKLKNQDLNYNLPKKRQYHVHPKTPGGERFEKNYYDLFGGNVPKDLLKIYHLMACQRNKSILRYSREGQRNKSEYFNENAHQGDLIIQTLRQLIEDGVIKNVCLKRKFEE